MTAFTGDETAISYYGDLRSFASMFKTSIYNVVTWISDAFIVRRLVSAPNKGIRLKSSPLAGVSHIHRMGPQLLGRAAALPTFPR